MKTHFFILLNLLFISSISIAQDDKYGETEKEQIICKEALSVYRGFRDQKAYNDAYINWQKACKVCPPDVSQRIYSDGVKFLKYELNANKDKARREVLIDSVLTLYDQRIAIFPTTPTNPNNRCEIIGFKASDLTQLRPDMVDEAFALFEESVNCLQEESKSSALSGYYQMLFKKLVSASPEDQAGLKVRMYRDYLMLQDYADAGYLQADEREKENYIKAKNNIDELFIPIANCDDMVPLLQSRYDQAPEDPELKLKIMKLLSVKECTDNKLYLKVAEELYNTNKSAEVAYSISIKHLKDGNYNKSLTYLREAVELCGTCVEAEKYMLKAGQVASVNGNTAEARSFAQKVLKLNPKSGAAYILIGDAVAGNSKACDDGGLGARSVYWLAADYYKKALLTDSSVADEANKKIARAEAQFPSRSDLFTFGKKEGDSFIIPCMGESTTIRERK